MRAEAGQRLGGTSGAVQGVHPQLDGTFTERVLVQHGGEHVGGLSVLGAEDESGRPVLPRVQAQPFQPDGLRGGEVLVRMVGVGRAAPQSHRGAEQIGGLCRRGEAGTAAELLEALDVHHLRHGAQHVTAGDGGEALVTERRTEPGEHRVQRAARVCGQGGRPGGIDEGVRRDGPTPGDQQASQHGALMPRGQVDGIVPAPHLHGSQNAVVQGGHGAAPSPPVV